MSNPLSKLSDHKFDGPLPFRTVICYGVGHFLNDMTAACWFNYLLVFLIQVEHLGTASAGLVMLCGQVADAISTPLVGYYSDRTNTRWGRRKIWLFMGAIIVNLSFFFVFSRCLLCEFESNYQMKVAYYSVLAALFNVGWASVQVSHMSLVPEITFDEHERVKLNSARYAGNIAATLCVLGTAWFGFSQYGLTEQAFDIVAVASLGMCILESLLTGVAIGDFFTLVFLFGVKEHSEEFLLISHSKRKQPRHSIIQDFSSPNTSGILSYPSTDAEEEYPSQVAPAQSEIESTWKWFKEPMFYQVAVVYMTTRVAVNISQIFMPFYLEHSLGLEKHHETAVAEIPLVLMCGSLLTTLVLKKLNMQLGRRSTHLIGAVLVCASLAEFYFLRNSTWEYVFAGAFVLGVGTSTIFVGSVSMTADLVGDSVRGAFVYGALSFTDKLANGILIQITSGYSDSASGARLMVVWIPSVACLISVATAFTIVRYYKKTDKKSQQKKSQSSETRSLLRPTDEEYSTS